MVRQVLVGLDLAHQRGIVHRDIKPENVLLAGDGVVKILDFGIARAQQSDEVFRTRTNVILGTPAYIAPEVVKGGVAKASADLYACGIMLYELIVGAPPFSSESVSAMLVAHLEKVPPSPSEHAIDLPRALETVLMDLLEKDPMQRPSTAATAAELLAPFETAILGADEAIPAAVEQTSPRGTLAVRSSSAAAHGTMRVTSDLGIQPSDAIPGVVPRRGLPGVVPINVTRKDTPSE
jgi:serine/threonine-protein kinase